MNLFEMFSRPENVKQYPEAKFNEELNPEEAKVVFQTLLAKIENKEQGN